MREEIRYFSAGAGEPFAIDIAGISWCDGSYRIARTNSPLWVMEYVKKGSGTLVINGVSYTASAGSVYLLPKGADHLYYADPEDPWEKIFFNLRGELPGKILESYGLTGRVVYENCPLEKLFEEFYALADPEREQESLLRCALKFHEICAEMHALFPAASDDPPEARRLKEYLDSRLSSLVSIRELASSIYRSPDYTIKLFKKTYGQTPYAYLLKRKMELAGRLLSSTALPVAEIAEELGYSDPHYFSGLFKRQTGQTPGEYRKGRQ